MKRKNSKFNWVCRLGRVVMESILSTLKYEDPIISWAAGPTYYENETKPFRQPHYAVVTNHVVTDSLRQLIDDRGPAETREVL